MPFLWPQGRTFLGLSRKILWLAAGLSVLLPSLAAAAKDPPAVRILALEDQRLSGPDLRTFLADKDPRTRGRAALAIGRIGQPEDVPSLLPLLSDRKAEVRQWAVFALGLIGDSAAADPLARLLTPGQEKDARVRALAVEALGKMRVHPEACRQSLFDREAEVQAAALLAAWRIPGTQPLDDVLRFCGEKDAELRWPAAYCLMRLAGAGASGKTPIPAATALTSDERARAGESLRQLASDQDMRVRLQAARGLSSFGDTASTKVLLRSLGDPDWRVRVEAVRSLARGTGRPVALSDLDSALVDPNPNVRVTAVEALETIGTAPDAIEKLRSLLRDPLPRIRQVAFEALLGRYGPAAPAAGARGPGARETAANEPAPRAEVDTLCRRILADRDWSTRALAADGAILLPPATRRPILEAMLRDDPRVAMAAVEPYLHLRAAGGSGPLLDRARPQLDSLLAAPDPILRAVTIGAAGALVSDSSLAPSERDRSDLDTLLGRAFPLSQRGTGEGEVRQAVMETAARHPERPALAAILNACCADSDYLVREGAVAALRRAGLQPPREAEPAVGGMAVSDYAAILKWADHDHWAVIRCEEGALVVRLFSREAPLTCWNFARLASESFFDQGRWHRVVPDFVLQDGDPHGDGYGGSPEHLRDEINLERYLAGTLGMALSGKDTGSSQFFLTHSDQPHLDGRYTVFGRIEKGEEIADRIIQGAAVLSIRVVDRRP